MKFLVVLVSTDNPALARISGRLSQEALEQTFGIFILFSTADATRRRPGLRAMPAGTSVPMA
jgi:hypothetical protein